MVRFREKMTAEFLVFVVFCMLIGIAPSWLLTFLIWKHTNKSMDAVFKMRTYMPFIIDKQTDLLPEDSEPKEKRGITHI